MAALASSDVTITVQKTVITGKLRRTRCKIQFGNGALTYPSGGVPLPSAAKFGLKSRLDYIILTDSNDASGFIWKYDQENHKLRAWRQNLRTGSTAASTSANGALVENSAGAETTFRAYGVAVDTDVDIGAMGEMGTAIAPAAQTLYCEAVGW